IGRRDVGWWLRGLAGAARRPVPALVPITLAIALALSLVALQSVLRDAEAYRSAVAGVADGRVIALTETGEAAAARGSLVVPKVGQPYLVLILPKPPADRTWEAWILRGDEPIAAGVSGDRSGVVTIVLTAPLRDGDGVAVTLERAGGVARPTTPPILVGRVS
ncbi:MAG: anti-sigma factor, partial [Candidatus Limnocylindria bacterium]